MLLFQQKDRASTETSVRKFYVFSARTAVNEQLCQQFRLAGFNAVEGIEQDITQLSHFTIPDNASGVVVDIGSSTEVMEMVNTLQMQVPRKVWCCVVGESDSITLAQTFAHNNVGYFNLHMQQDLMVQAALGGIELRNNRSAVNISVLGCKGGVGCTTIAWQLAGEITRLKQLPTLFIQGGCGSRDLDLYAGKKLSQEITSLQKNLDIMSSAGGAWPELPSDIAQHYNFVVFEQSITTADKELMRQLAEKSRCLVLVIERSLASVRVARGMIENIELLRRSSHTPRRLFVCLNDTRPVALDALSLMDIKTLLGHPIDIAFTYNRRQSPPKQAKKRLIHSPLDRLTSAVLGGESARKKSRINRLFSHLRRGN
ncbi:hypothetical protein PMPD1_3714 [Paramixta manurensis]|uniref:Pilus assembly protein CpaE n=1 Tax=Paramixta manurensis TaxID=2740817 RepID=A0A6M8UD49_9GAMM|nr:hypothetical protein PMPD1_3714 [Erwiniaceae bacterium PD-1]